MLTSCVYLDGMCILEIGCAYFYILLKKKRVIFFEAHPMSGYEVPFSRDILILIYIIYISIYIGIVCAYVDILCIGLRNTSPAEDCLLPQRHPPRPAFVISLWSKLALAGSSERTIGLWSFCDTGSWELLFQWFLGLR